MPTSAAFLYDFMLVRGGAEQTAIQLKRALPDLDMVFGFVDRKAFPPGDYPASHYRGLTTPSRVRGWQGLKALSAFKRRAGFLRDYESVIYSGVYAPAAVRHHDRGPNIYYCHTPPRFVYDLRSHYLATAPVWQRPLIRSLIPYVRRHYEEAVGAMDTVIANSRNVRDRLRTHLGIEDVEILHPPVATGDFRWLGQDGYYLSTARLEEYKRVELIVRAFKELPGHRLIIASGGNELSALRRLAEGHANISFAGWCNASEMRALIGRCTATIYLPRDEDFGMSPVESMAAGKPVIGVAEGGLKETVAHGATGLLLKPGQLRDTESAVNALALAVQSLDAKTALAMRAACEARAQHFGADVFNARMRALLDSP